MAKVGGKVRSSYFLLATTAGFFKLELIDVIKNLGRIFTGKTSGTKNGRVLLGRGEHAVEAQISDAIDVQKLFDLFHRIVAGKQLFFGGKINSIIAGRNMRR